MSDAPGDMSDLGDMSEGLLAGTRILDLTDEPLAQAGRLLADLGADVIRVESAAGDGLRRRAPFVDDAEGDLEAGWAHLLYNAGKRSLAVDTEDAAVWAALTPLVAHCDALLAPLAPGAALAAWLADRGAWPRRIPLVECVFRRGGARDEPVSDLTAMAAGGHLALNGFPEDPPIWPAGNLAYKQVSLAAAEAAAALIFEQRRGGGPSDVVVSMQEAVAFTTLQTANVNYYHWHGQSPDRHTPIGSGATYLSADRHWLSFTIHPPHWPRFVEWADRVLGAAQLRDERFDDEGYRGERFHEEIRPFVERLCAELTLDELTAEGQRLGLLVLPFNTPQEVAADAHLRSRGFFQSVAHPKLGRELQLARSSVRWRGHQPQARRAPSLGEHSEAIVRELAGWGDAEVSAARARGALVGPAPSAAVAPTGPKPQTRYVESAPPPPRKPLDGVRILDFCWAIAGPLGTRLLADLGAEVIKIESERRLDPIRYIGVQPPERFSLNTNGVFNDCSAGKRSVTLNMSTPQGVALIRELAASADVVTSNYTPYVLDRWGVGYDELRKIRSDIIVCNVAVMGIEGERAEWRSYGNGIVAMCGLAQRSGFAERPPICFGSLHTDFTVPYYLAMSVIAALDARNRTGEGRYLELAQYETATQLLDTELIEALNGAAEQPRLGNRSPRHAPHGVFPTAEEDRWVAVACRGDADWRALCGAIGRADLAARDDLATLPGRQAAVEELESALAAWTRQYDQWEASRLLLDAGLPASPVERLADFFERDERMRGAYAQVESPEAATLHVQREPILWNGERLEMTRAPLWGEHTEAVLKGLLGKTDAEIAELAAANVLH